MDNQKENKPVKALAPRFSNLELSRIFAMFLIVAHHFSVHGRVPIWHGDYPLSFNYYFDQMMSTGGKIGVNLFVLISGYFLITKISKMSSLVYLWLTTFFYVILFFAIFTICGVHQFTWSGLIACFFPIRNDAYWFVSAYFLLILLSPFITIGFNALTNKQLLSFLIVFGIVWSVIPTLTTQNEYYGSTLLWFVYIFAWGGYLRRTEPEKRFGKPLYWAGVLGAWLLIAIITLLADLSNRYVDLLPYIDWFTFANMNSVFSLIAALSIFMIFKTWDMPYVPWINKTAGAMLGVYLIHENPILYPWMWKSLFDVPAHLNDFWFPLWALGVTTLIFVACTLIDLGREHYMRKWFNETIRVKLAPWDKKISTFFSERPVVAK
ncbi:MAG: acyltransferase [Burkholderiales bacterium]|nr:acyltransferase [Burkholderiales bacterium]